MTVKKKICVVTGSRAEYGLLFGLLKGIKADPDLKLQIIATGMHLSPEFGLTYRQIEEDGFTIDSKVEMLLSADSSTAVTKSLGLGVIGFADALNKLAPDIMVVLGDRFEILASAQAAMIAKIPIAHIHGGETTEGAFDEGIRHAITKMSHIHFTASESYRRRVIQLGELPDHVFNVGAPGLDYLTEITWISRDELSESLGLPLNKPLFLVTYHPATLSDVKTEASMRELLKALDCFNDATIVFTYPNADTNGRAIIQLINEFVECHPKTSRAFASLGQQRYLSLMRESDVVIGNSSSALIEAPALKIATINIGDRQKGRLKASSVIDVSDNSDQIVSALHQAMSDLFRKELSTTESLYGNGGASLKILSFLKSFKPHLQKKFFDISHGY